MEEGEDEGAVVDDGADGEAEACFPVGEDDWAGPFPEMSLSRLARSCLNSASACSSRVRARGSGVGGCGASLAGGELVFS